MKLSTKSRYGLRAMIDLALHYKQGHVAVGDISKREDISTHYLEQILSKLRREGLLKSVRGARGGYALAKPPGKITVGRIVGILEGGIELVNCTSGTKKSFCKRIDRCLSRLVWEKLNACINEVLDSTTLADLLKEAKERGIDKKLEHDYTFHI